MMRPRRTPPNEFWQCRRLAMRTFLLFAATWRCPLILVVTRRTAFDILCRVTAPARPVWMKVYSITRHTTPPIGALREISL